jgi:2-polyprenyl-6-hydroxyphenyl methylase/3-demethylubiquinone-9 3-methyltransferase
VKDNSAAFLSIASLLKKGGKALIFVPSRNALYARLNVILPEKLKKKMLHTIFPESQSHQGYPSYYDRCTPLQFRALAAFNGLSLVEEKVYYSSGYFTFFFPLHLIWRMWIIVYRAFAGMQAAETYTMVLRKE